MVLFTGKGNPVLKPVPKMIRLYYEIGINPRQKYDCSRISQLVQKLQAESGKEKPEVKPEVKKVIGECQMDNVIQTQIKQEKIIETTQINTTTHNDKVDLLGNELITRQY